MALDPARDALPPEVTLARPPSRPDDLPQYLEGQRDDLVDQLRRLALLAPQAADREPPVKLHGMLRLVAGAWAPAGSSTPRWVWWDSAAGAWRNA